jgi:hypothetical protein
MIYKGLCEFFDQKSSASSERPKVWTGNAYFAEEFSRFPGQQAGTESHYRACPNCCTPHLC